MNVLVSLSASASPKWKSGRGCDSTFGDCCSGGALRTRKLMRVDLAMFADSAELSANSAPELRFRLPRVAEPARNRQSVPKNGREHSHRNVCEIRRNLI